MKRLSGDKAYIDSVIKENAEKANYYAMKTLRKVQRKVGFPDRSGKAVRNKEEQQ